MSENLTPAEKEFQERKQKELEEHPDKADRINLASNMTELFHAVTDEDGETEPQNGAEAPKTLGVVKHIHEMAKKEKEGSNLEGGESLASTGGQISLTPEQMGHQGSYDPTEYSKSGSGKQVIASLLDEIDLLEYKQSTKGLKPSEARRYKLLRVKEEELLHSMWLGYRARGGVKKGNFWKCPQCGMDVINSNRCSTCGYIVNSKIDLNEKRRWQILRG